MKYFLVFIYYNTITARHVLEINAVMMHTKCNIAILSKLTYDTLCRSWVTQSQSHSLFRMSFVKDFPITVCEVSKLVTAIIDYCLSVFNNECFKVE